MTRKRSGGAMSGVALAILLGIVGGLALLALSRMDSGWGGPTIDRSGRIEIAVNGIEHRMSRDVLLPNYGWALQVRHPGIDAATARAGIDLRLRSERTGATIQIEDHMEFGDGRSTLLVRESLGIAEGLLSVRARLRLSDSELLEDSRRIRIRRWFGGTPIGSRQVIDFDFEVDHDGDAIPDFVQDLERLGLLSNARPDLAREVAARIEARAIERVERAYDPTDDPNQTGLARDPVHVLFRFTTDPAALITRICVGGQDPSQSASVGHVRFDRRNEDKFSTDCGGENGAGIYPSELEIYRDAGLSAEILAPFLASEGGRPIGENATDSLARLDDSTDPRAIQIERAIEVLGRVLGSIMAHEAGHALGLVAEGKPGIGLFGGTEGDAYAHNLDADSRPETTLWLMNPGKGFSFEELAGESAAGELRFRPLNYAYLRDRIVLADQR